MDSRFKNLDSELNFTPDKGQMDAFFNQFDTAAMDNAFVEASQNMQYPYALAYWDNYVSQEGQLIQDVNFAEAAFNYNTAYHPMYWNAAQEVLADEGLHYQYKSAYWSEAQKLLIAAERSVFFSRWIAIASVLLLIGFGSQLFTERSIFNTAAEVVNTDLNDGQIEPPSKNTAITADLKSNQINQTINGFSKNGNDNFEKDLQSSDRSDVLSENTINQPQAGGIEKSYSENNTNANKAAAHKNQVQTQVSSKPKKNISPSTANDLNKSLMLNPSNSLTQNDNNKISATVSSSQSRNSNSLIATLPTVSSANTLSQQRQKSEEILKVNLAEPILLSCNSKPIPSPVAENIETNKKQNRNWPQIYVLAQTGIGNTFSDSKTFNQRIGLDLGLSFNIPKTRGFKLSFLSGLDYQSLNNYTNSHQITDYERSGKITKMSYGYEFNKLVKWQSAMLLGYSINQKITINMGAAVDQYFTSQIKVHEVVKDDIQETAFKWGKNDFINERDIQLLGQLEYHFSKKLSIVASGEFGLLNQINLAKNPLLTPKMNRSVMVGIKYSLF